VLAALRRACGSAARVLNTLRCVQPIILTLNRLLTPATAHGLMLRRLNMLSLSMLSMLSTLGMLSMLNMLC
jgi:hypothetical protein